MSKMASVLALTCACGEEAPDTTVLPEQEREDPVAPICGAVACDSDFLIELEQPAAWPPGTYHVVVGMGGKTESCAIELGAADAAKGPCAAESFTVAFVTEGRVELTSNRGLPSERDRALAAGAPAITSVRVDRDEDAIVVVLVEGPSGLVSQGALQPAWGEPFYPNGPECSPRCRTAPAQTIAVELPEAVGE
jgi:hypothetical protein